MFSETYAFSYQIKQVPAHELFLVLPELKKAVESSFDQKAAPPRKGGFGFGQQQVQVPGFGFGFGQNTPQPSDNKNPLKSLVDFIEKEFESRVSGIKEMINEVSSK